MSLFIARIRENVPFTNVHLSCLAQAAMPRLSRRSNMAVRAGGFIGSANNLVSCMCLASICVYSPNQRMRNKRAGYSTQKACL